MNRELRPRGEARREAILRATLELIGEHGGDAVTHRAVAERAGVPLSATTYYFVSRDELLEQTMLLAAREEIAWIERLVLDLVARDLSVAEWAAAVAGAVAREAAGDPARQVALYELGLEAGRRPALRAEVERWQVAQLRLAQMGARAAGSDDPRADAPIVLATLTGLTFGQVTNPHPDFEDAVLRPTLERLFSRLAMGGRTADQPASALPGR